MIMTMEIAIQSGLNFDKEWYFTFHVTHFLKRFIFTLFQCISLVYSLRLQHLCVPKCKRLSWTGRQKKFWGKIFCCCRDLSLDLYQCKTDAVTITLAGMSFNVKLAYS
jgi:hypothetical protein